MRWMRSLIETHSAVICDILAEKIRKWRVTPVIGSRISLSVSDRLPHDKPCDL